MSKRFIAIAALLILLFQPFALAAPTKADTVVANNVTLTAGGGLVTQGANTDITGSYAQLVTIKFTNGATGPTVPAQCQAQVAGSSGGTYYAFGSVMVSATGNNVVTDFSFEMPPATMFVQFSCGNNTVQNVTLRIESQKITGI